ncbi:MAG: DsbE family thiol:disulfide interchange protein [Alphaproteobacteria bacterium]
MKGMRLSFILPVAIFALMVAMFSIYLFQVGFQGKDIKELPSALIDKPAPKLDLPSIDGDGPGLSSNDLRDKVSLVNVWASWCPPCRVEHPILMRLSAEGIPIYGINYKDKPADANRFLSDLGNPFRAIGADRTGRAVIDWGVYGYPETFIIDRAGRIRYRHVGAIYPRDLEKFYSKIKDLKQ